MISSKFNTETKILEVVYSGKISPKELNKLGAEIMNNKELPGKLNIITDARNAIYNIKDVENITFNKIQLNMKKYLEPYISENNLNVENYLQKVFCTKSAAISWLKGDKK